MSYGCTSGSLVQNFDAITGLKFWILNLAGLNFFQVEFCRSQMAFRAFARQLDGAITRQTARCQNCLHQSNSGLKRFLPGVADAWSRDVVEIRLACSQIYDITRAHQKVKGSRIA